MREVYICNTTEWSKVFCSQQPFCSHEWRQVVYTCKQEIYVPETKSDIWADFGLRQWWVQDWHWDSGSGVGVMRKLKLIHWYNKILHLHSVTSSMCWCSSAKQPQFTQYPWRKIIMNRVGQINRHNSQQCCHGYCLLLGVPKERSTVKHHT